MKVSRTELQRIIRKEKVRLRREGVRSASRKTGSISGGAGKKSHANRLRRFDEQSTPAAGMTGMEIQPSIDAIEDIIGNINAGFVGEPT